MTPVVHHPRVCVKSGRLRTFTSRAEAIDYANRCVPQWRPMICVVLEDTAAFLYWFVPRVLSRRRQHRLRAFLDDGCVCSFSLGSQQGHIAAMPPGTIKHVASTICGLIGVAP